MAAENKKGKKLSSNMEDYLERIYALKKENNVARVRDISRLMKVKTSSVTAALNTLVKKGLVVHERYGYVEFTAAGEKKAKNIDGIHKMLFRLLNEILNVNYKTAQEDACKMEHILSQESLKKITKFIEFVATCPEHDRPDWLKSFDHYFKTGKRPNCKIKQMKKNALTG